VQLRRGLLGLLRENLNSDIVKLCNILFDVSQQTNFATLILSRRTCCKQRLSVINLRRSN